MYKESFDQWLDKEIPFESVDPEAKWHQMCRYSSRYINFVETGTAHGVTTEVVAKFYPRVWTIELAEDYYTSAMARLGKYSHVKQLLGSSAARLQEVVDEINGPAVYYLDGHYSGPGTGQDNDIDTPDTPIMNELEILAEQPHPNVIIIDDARLFKGEEHHDERFAQYPDFGTIESLVESLPVESKVYRELDAFIVEPLKPRPERKLMSAGFVPPTTRIQGS